MFRIVFRKAEVKWSNQRVSRWRYMKTYEDFWKFLIRFECNSEVILQSTCKCYGNRITNIDWIILDSEFFLRNPKFCKAYDQGSTDRWSVLVRESLPTLYDFLFPWDDDCIWNEQWTETWNSKLKSLYPAGIFDMDVFYVVKWNGDWTLSKTGPIRHFWKLAKSCSRLSKTFLHSKLSIERSV